MNNIIILIVIAIVGFGIAYGTGMIGGNDKKCSSEAIYDRYINANESSQLLKNESCFSVEMRNIFLEGKEDHLKMDKALTVLGIKELLELDAIARGTDPVISGKLSTKHEELKLLKRQEVINMLNKLNSADEKIYMMIVLIGILEKASSTHSR